MFVLAAALLLAACNPAEKLMGQVQSGGVGYVTVKDKNVPGRYQAEAAVDPNKGNDNGDVIMQALLNGLEEAQKDGYDLVTYSAPRRGTLTKTITTVSRYSPSSSYVAAQYPAMIIDVQGYKTTGDHPPNARPTAVVIAQVTADREKRRAARAAVGSITTQK
jgi:hypothetical protein